MIPVSQNTEDLVHPLTLILMLITWPFGQVKKKQWKRKKKIEEDISGSKIYFNTNTTAFSMRIILRLFMIVQNSAGYNFVIF